MEPHYPEGHLHTLLQHTSAKKSWLANLPKFVLRRLEIALRRHFYLLEEEKIVEFAELGEENVREHLAWAFLVDVPRPENKKAGNIFCQEDIFLG